jgi:hypothetical protein
LTVDAEGKEHGYGIKFWPIVVEVKPQGGEENSLPNATAGEGNSNSDAGPDQGGDGGEETGDARSGPHPPSSPRKKEDKTRTVEYDRYEGMWKEGWEHGVGKYTWYVPTRSRVSLCE